MAMSLSWKIGAGAAGLIVAMLAWNGFSRYATERHAQEVLRDSAHAAEQDAQQARARAQQHEAQLAADLRQQQEDLSNIHQEVNEQGQQIQTQQLIRQNEKLKEQLRVQSTYRLDHGQHCDAGIVINHSGSSFTPVMGRSGQPIKCQGDTAVEPLR
jgi:ABC-type lipoprotein release transport system permease subunit